MPITRGVSAPVVPIAVPVMRRDSGIKAASRITKGIERKTLTTALRNE